MTTTLLDRFMDKIDPAGCRISHRPEIVWVFGGSGVNSQRKEFNNFHLESPCAWSKFLDEIENYNDWIYCGLYEDLLEFERDACYLAQAIVLFAESAGALSELGFLASDDFLLRKTFLIINRKYTENHSFIQMGPVKRIKKYGCVCVVSDQFRIEDIKNINREIEKWFPKNKLLDICFNNPEHQLFLLIDIINIFLILRIDELQKILKFFSVKVEENKLKKMLKLLIFFKFIKEEKEIFFLGNKNKYNTPFVLYGSSKKFDRLNFKINAELFLDSDDEKKYIYRYLCNSCNF